MTTHAEVDAMQVLSWLIGILALGINAHAVVALVRGLRARDAAAVTRQARRCGWSVAAFIVVMGAGLAASTLTRGALRGDGPSARAERIASTIAELLNCAAFTVLGTSLPGVAAAVLHVRARRVA
jgi:hypothetical protein